MSTRAVQLPIFQSGFRDPSSDAPLALGSAEFYVADGTFTTPKNAYDDIDKGGTLTSVTLNTFGQYPNGLYFDGGQVYDIRVKDSADTVKYNLTDIKAPKTTTNSKTVTSSDTDVIDTDIVLCDTTSGAIVRTLPPVATATDPITYKNTGSSNNNVTVDGNGAELIDGAANIVLTDGEAQTLYPDGTQWRGQGISSGSGGLLLDIQIFAADGTWTKPNGTNYIEVEALGAGGGGGSVPGATGAAAGGGSGGAWCYRYVDGSATTIPTSVTVTVGAGGAGGLIAGAPNDGSDGEASSFGSLLTAPGGIGGTGGDGSATAAGVDGAGGVGSLTGATGLANVVGQSGGDGRIAGSLIFSGVGGATAVSCRDNSESIVATTAATQSPTPSANNNFGIGGKGAWSGSSGVAAAGETGGIGRVIVKSYT